MLPIAIVDDETAHIDFYVAAFRALGYEVRHFKSPDSFLTAFTAGELFSVFITDLMMHSFGRYSAASTNGFLTTGLQLVKDIRKTDDKTPIILFTNMNIEAILADVRLAAVAEGNVFFIRKIDYPPHTLAAAVDALLGGRDSLGDRRGILQRFWDSLVLEPKIFGMGIDFKKLVK